MRIAIVGSAGPRAVADQTAERLLVRQGYELRTPGNPGTADALEGGARLRVFR